MRPTPAHRAYAAARAMPRLSRAVGLGILAFAVLVLVVVRWGFGAPMLIAAPVAGGTLVVLVAGAVWIVARIVRALEAAARALGGLGPGGPGAPAGPAGSPDFHVSWPNRASAERPGNPKVIDGTVVSREEPPEG